MIVTLNIKYCMVTSNFSNLGFYHRLYGGRNLIDRKFSQNSSSDQNFVSVATYVFAKLFKRSNRPYGP
jgi:hypothetical protein